MTSSIRLSKARLATVPILLACWLVTSPARADVSSWIALYGGASNIGRLQNSRDWSPTLRLETGMGTDPSHALAVGGLLRTDTFFGNGTDLALLVRTASHGFVNGKWGIAVDLGAVARYWGTTSYGASGSVVIGGPWGLQLALGGSRGGHDLRALTAVVGIDLARLTVYRRSGANWWKNPFPAYRPAGERW